MSIFSGWSKLNRHGERLADIYPVLAYAPTNELFFLNDGQSSSLGLAFLADPLGGLDESVADRLHVFLNQELPQGSTLQFILLGSPAVEPLLRDNILTAATCVDNPLLKRIMDNKNEFLRNLSDGGTPGVEAGLRDFKLIVSMTIPCADAEPRDDEIQNMESLQRSLAENLRTAGFNYHVMTADSFLDTLAPFFNSDPNASWHNGNLKAAPDKPLALQLLDYDAALEVESDHLKVGGYVVNVMSFRELPECVFLGQAARYAGDLLTGSRGINVPFMMTGTIVFTDSMHLRNSLAARRQWAVNQAYGPLVKFMPRLALKKKGFDIICAQLENGDRPLRFNLTLCTFVTNDAQAERVTTGVRSYFREMGFSVMPDRFCTLPLFINALPMGAEGKALKSMQRLKTLAPKFIIPLLPLFADGKGTGSSVINLISRHGQLMNVSLFDSPTNFNLCIAAQSGSGKSFLVNEIIVSYLARGAMVYVIDVGRSYQKLAEFLGGSFMSFGFDSGVSLNPFAGVRDYGEEADVLSGLLAAMCAPTERLSDFQMAELKRITGEEFKVYGKELTLDLLAKRLCASSDVRVKDMGMQLHPFTKEGEYGRFFAGTGVPPVPKADFTVLELEELKGRRHLQQVVLLQLIYRIQQEMYLGARNRRKLVIIDEAWDLLREGSAASFIENGYRRFRKYGGAAVTVTQSINDLYSSDIGRAIVENSAGMFLLGQKAETVSALEQNGRLPLSPGEFRYLRSVHTASDRYSEIFLITAQGNAVGRLVVDPFRRLLYSTKADDVASLEALTAQGLSVGEAIETLLKARVPRDAC